MLLLAALGFGTGFVGIEVGLDALPPLLFAALRYDLGALVLGEAVPPRTALGFALVERRGLRRELRRARARRLPPEEAGEPADYSPAK